MTEREAPVLFPGIMQSAPCDFWTEAQSYDMMHIVGVFAARNLKFPEKWRETAHRNLKLVDFSGKNHYDSIRIPAAPPDC